MLSFKPPKQIPHEVNITVVMQERYVIGKHIDSARNGEPIVREVLSSTWSSHKHRTEVSNIYTSNFGITATRGVMDALNAL